MRQFVILGHDVPTTAEFALDNLTGAGRLDLLARCVTASLLLSHGIREGVRTHLVLDDEFTLRFDGASLQGLHPDERSTAARIRTALDQRDEAIGHIPVEVSPGIELIRRGFAETLGTVESEGTVVQLHETGTPAVEAEPPEDPVFVLSDNQDFTDEEHEKLQEQAATCLSFGPEVLHADHTIAVAHNWLDTDGCSQ